MNIRIAQINPIVGDIAGNFDLISKTIISSPDKEVAASAQNGANTIQILNSSGLSFASTFNIGLASLALGLIAASVWDGSESEQSSSSSTTN